MTTDRLGLVLLAAGTCGVLMMARARLHDRQPSAEAAPHGVPLAMAMPPCIPPTPPPAPPTVATLREYGKPEPMRGPFASLSDACASCAMLDVRIQASSPPFDELTVLVTPEANDPTQSGTHLQLAVHVAGSWWFRDLGYTGPGTNKRDYDVSMVTTASAPRRDGRRLIIDTSSRGDGAVFWASEDRTTCEVDATGTPACTPEVIATAIH